VSGDHHTPLTERELFHGYRGLRKPLREGDEVKFRYKVQLTLEVESNSDELVTLRTILGDEVESKVFEEKVEDAFATWSIPAHVRLGDASVEEPGE